MLWAVPPVAMSIAAVMVLMQLRSMTEAATALSVQLRRLDEVRVAVATVRTEAAAARATVRGLRQP